MSGEPSWSRELPFGRLRARLEGVRWRGALRFRRAEATDEGKRWSSRLSITMRKFEFFTNTTWESVSSDRKSLLESLPRSSPGGTFKSESRRIVGPSILAHCLLGIDIGGSVQFILNFKRRRCRAYPGGQKCRVAEACDASCWLHRTKASALHQVLQRLEIVGIKGSHFHAWNVPCIYLFGRIQRLKSLAPRFSLDIQVFCSQCYTAAIGWPSTSQDSGRKKATRS